MMQVFISYSRNDMDFVQHLAADLKRAGLEVWWDLSDIQGSDVWERRIEEGLNSSQYFIVVLSPSSLESRWVRREYLSADNKGIKIIPLKLKAYTDLPLTLRDIQPINAIDREYADVLSDILKILKVQMPDPADVINPRGISYSGPKKLSSPIVLTKSTPIGLLDLAGLILPIVYFIIAGLEVLDLTGGDDTSFIWGLCAILTAIYLFIKRHISPGLPIKISLIVFLLAHSVVAYSESTGRDLTIIPSIVEGLAALIVAGLLLANLRSPKRPAPYSSITFGAFLLLVGTKIFINLFGGYPSGIYTFIVLAAVIASIVLWLDQ
jgi:hypothetical protein